MADPRISEHLAVVRQQSKRADGRRWLAMLPTLIDETAESWDLELGEPFTGGSAAWVAPARRRSDGADAVLKITLPHPEARTEAAGLRVWDGNGAVRLFAESADGFSLLVERCRPGTNLWDEQSSTEELLTLGAEILVRLWDRSVPEDAPFETVDGVCRGWAEFVRTRHAATALDLDGGLVEIGAHLLDTLPLSASRRVVIHGDFNPGNILRAEREPWLVIDPKPMVGDPAYDVYPLAAELGFVADEPPNVAKIRRNFDLVAGIVGEPVERLLAWAAARSVESALWHASLNEEAQAVDMMAWARAFADLAGV